MGKRKNFHWKPTPKRTPISKGKRIKVFNGNDWKCWYCGIGLIHPDNVDWSKAYENPHAPVVDHIVPAIHGGLDDIENLRSSCWRCNQHKHSKTVEEYRDYLTIKFNPMYQCQRHLLAALFAHETPFDQAIQDAIDWLGSHIKPVVFYGELNRD